MPINPALKLKLDELFLRWLTDPATQKVLHENLVQLKANASLETMLAVPSGAVVGPMSSALYSYFYGTSTCESPGPNAEWASSGYMGPSGVVGSLVSPRPNTPPYFPQPPHSKMFSPRSPRRQSTGQSGHSQSTNKTTVEIRPSDNSIGKRPKDDDDTARVSSKTRSLSDTAQAAASVDDGPGSRAALKTVPVNENDLHANKATSKPNERVLAKQPLSSSVSGSDQVLHNRVTSREAGRHSATSGGDVNSAMTKANNIRLEPQQQPHHAGPDLPIPPVSKSQPAPYSPRKPHVPAFHFPLGSTRMTSDEVASELDRAKRELGRTVDAVASNDGKKPTADVMIPYSSFGQVAKALNCPFYWKYPIYSASGGDADRRPITLSSVLKMWQRVLTNCPDESARFIYMLTGGRSSYLDPAHFDPLIQDILESHPGLEFLREAEDFHSRYVSTVVSRIFFNVNASWSGRISLSELRRSNFLSVLASLEDQRDINLITHYFSYEHFYVIYCKFWELDDDHDLIISRSDLARHNNYAISERMIDRIFSGTVTKGTDFKEGLMRYPDFVWFLLAEEDKRHPRSVEYWFRCMDLDGDGLLSMYELEYFYSEQLARMEEMGIEPISFEDCLCQCLDMVKPVLGNKIRLSDMKRCRLCHIFFDTFFNLPKYLQHEQRDPFANLRDIEEGLNELSDWDRYAAEAYEMLITIENGNREDVVDEDDVEEDIDDAVLATPLSTTAAASDRETMDYSLSPESNRKMQLTRTSPINGTLQN